MTVVALIDARAHPTAAEFYRSFPFEPIGDGDEIRLDQVHPIRSMNLESLLGEIIHRVPVGSDLVIVSHGTEMGLSMPLLHHGSHGVRGDFRIMSALDDSSRSEQEVAQILLMSHPATDGAARVNFLRGRINQVKQLRLRRVELRSCNTGSHPDVMQTIKRFFGAGTLGAPDIRDSYATLNPGTPNPDQAFWQRWLQQHPRNRVYEMPLHGRVALATSGGEVGHTSFQLDALADTAVSVGFWADLYLAGLHTAVNYRHGGLPTHALWDSNAPFPLIFPGDDTYSSHIEHV